MRATILLSLLIVAIGVFLPQVLQYLRTPAGTVYTFAEGYVPDYYQYLSWIKSGMEGHLLLSSQYLSSPQPAALVHPLFSLTGIIAGFFHLSAPVAYLVLRIVAILIFFFTLYAFIKIWFPSVKDRIISLLFFLTGTGFETIPWSGHFNIISKYSLPPHHLLALAAWMGIIMAFAKQKIVFSIVLGWVLALLNPSIFLFAMIFLACTQILNSKFWILLLGVSPVLLYNLFVLRSLPPWSIMYQRMLSFNPPTTLIDYLLSLSPLLPLSLLGAWKMRNSILIAWAYLPIVMFPFVGIIPINYSRLFQTYQYIPITIFAVYFLRTLLAASQGESLQRLVGGLVIATLIVYGAIAYIATLKPQLQPHYLSYYNVFVPKSLLAAFKNLDALPEEQVVLSGEYVSQMIPAYTRHRTVIGRDDSNLNYYPLRDRAFAFLDGRVTEEEAMKFIEEQKVSYVIFGVDTKPLSDLPTKNYRFLVPIFTDGTVSVTLVQ